MHHRLLSIFCVATSALTVPAHSRPPGIGWSISAIASGWTLQRVNEAGKRLVLSCSPTTRGRSIYQFAVRSNQTRLPDRSDYAELTIDDTPEPSIYQLAVDAPGSGSVTLKKTSFTTLMRRLNSLNLGEFVSSPKLGLHVEPRNADQETTFSEFTKLCGSIHGISRPSPRAAAKVRGAR